MVAPRPSDEVAGLVGHRARMVVLELLARLLDALALAEQELAEVIGRNAGHARPFASAAARRRSVSSADKPLSSTSLSRVVCPPTTLTSPRGSDRVPASSSTTASLARPRSGAARTRIFHASPWRPTMPGLAEPGMTRTRSLVPFTAPV